MGIQGEGATLLKAQHAGMVSASMFRLAEGQSHNVFSDLSTDCFWWGKGPQRLTLSILPTLLDFQTSDGLRH
jgi:hypothetical protein